MSGGRHLLKAANGLQNALAEAFPNMKLAPPQEIEAKKKMVRFELILTLFIQMLY